MDYVTKFIHKHPHFLDPSQGSNFNKHSTIIGEELLNIRQTINDLQWDKALTKPIEIWKIQTTDHNYTIHFKINTEFDNVYFFEDNEIIDPYYVEEGHYIYTKTGTEIIPTTKYSVIVNKDNYVWEKGIPENTTIENNIYDIDLSLDQIGEYVNLPRRTYKTVTPDQYPFTIPSYNNEPVESDYWYSQRLKEFFNNINTKNLPLLYLKAWLNVDGTLVNREKLLCKMAPGNEYGELPDDDNPLVWEHRDQMCMGDAVEDYLFFYTVNTRRPLADTLLKFKFIFVDTQFNQQEVPGVIVPYINGDNNFIGALNSNQEWDVVANTLGQDEFSVRFKYFNSNNEAIAELIETDGAFLEEGLFTNEYLINIVSCSNADVYISREGSDITGTGAEDNPYATVKYGISKSYENDTVVIGNGIFHEDLIICERSLNILGCPETQPIIDANQRMIMTIAPNKNVTINNITMSGELDYTLVQGKSFNNQSNSLMRIVKKQEVNPISTSAVVGVAVAGDAVVGREE